MSGVQQRDDRASRYHASESQRDRTTRIRSLSPRQQAMRNASRKYREREEDQMIQERAPHPRRWDNRHGTGPSTGMPTPATSSQGQSELRSEQANKKRKFDQSSCARIAHEVPSGMLAHPQTPEECEELIQYLASLSWPKPKAEGSDLEVKHSDPEIDSDPEKEQQERWVDPMARVDYLQRRLTSLPRSDEQFCGVEYAKRRIEIEVTRGAKLLGDALEYFAVNGIQRRDLDGNVFMKLREDRKKLTNICEMLNVLSAHANSGLYELNHKHPKFQGPGTLKNLKPGCVISATCIAMQRDNGVSIKSLSKYI